MSRSSDRCPIKVSTGEWRKLTKGMMMARGVTSFGAFMILLPLSLLLSYFGSSALGAMGSLLLLIVLGATTILSEEIWLADVGETLPPGWDTEWSGHGAREWDRLGFLELEVQRLGKMMIL
ncbi:hypothetical protein SUGI_0466210 [Cryptomeria japonica]|nr:hypothetical protein SUGI_0466210 [Cryptomeria japonica]